MIPYGRQSIISEDIEAVISVLKSDFLTTGPAIPEFEKAVAEYTGSQYSVAVSSATAALHISCIALDLKRGDWVWTVPNTFVASANCALYCGAQVDFVDIDPVTYNMSAGALESKLKATPKERIPKAVIPVHFAGQSCDMRAIKNLSLKYGFSVIEDASHAIGGSYLGKRIGSCQFSDLCVFSFHPVKIITTGEGGMVLTNSKELYEKLVRLRTHGITRDPRQMKSECEGPWYYQQLELGFNYRMTDLQAALGTSQLKRIDSFIARRLQIVEKYNRELAGLPLVLPRQSPDTESAWHLYVVCLDERLISKSRLDIFNELRELGVGVNVHYIPVHRQPYYENLGFKAGDFPESEYYYSRAISLPIYYGLTDSEQNLVIKMLKEVLL